MKGNGKGSRMVTFSVSRELLQKFDNAIEGTFDNRSEAYRAFMRETVEKAEAKPQ